MKNLITVLFFTPATIGASFGQSIKIDLAKGTDREQQTKTRLEQVIASYDLRKYPFTREVMIEERAINHAFPKLTLNARLKQLMLAAWIFR